MIILVLKISPLDFTPTAFPPSMMISSTGWSTVYTGLTDLEPARARPPTLVVVSERVVNLLLVCLAVSNVVRRVKYCSADTGSFARA